MNQAVTTPLSSEFAVAALSSAGTRAVNEDLVMVDPDQGVFLVVDGIGGAGKGDLASSIVRESVAAGGLEGGAALFEANRRLLEMVQGSPEHKGMGATAGLGVLQGDRLTLHHVGEVRAFLLRGGALTQLTEDHTLAAQMVKLKQLKPEQAAQHPTRKTILRYLGKDAALKLDQSEIQLQPGDVVLLCSDGFYGSLSAEEMGLLASDQTEDLEARLAALMERALTNGSQDNLSAVVIQRSPVLSAVVPGGPTEVSARLRGLLESILTAAQPAEALTGIFQALLPMAADALRATSGLMVAEVQGEWRVIASMMGSRRNELSLLEQQRPLLESAAAHPKKLHRGRDGELAAAFVTSTSARGTCRVGFCLVVAPIQDIKLETLTPFLELAAWYGPLSSVAEACIPLEQAR